MKVDIQEIKLALQRNDVEYVKVAITDLDGVLRGKYMHVNKFLKSLESGYVFCDVIYGWDSSDALYEFKVSEVIKNTEEDNFRGEVELSGGDPRRVTVGYHLTRACLIEPEATQKPTKKGKGPKQTGFKVKLTPWLPLTKTDPIAVPCDWIVTIAAPVDNLREMYKEDVGMTDNGLVKVNVDTNLLRIT